MNHVTVALIKNKRVVNTIMCDSSMLPVLAAEYDYAIDTSDVTPIPGINCYYNAHTNTFSPVPTLVIDEPVDQSSINIGNNLSFPTFDIEQYTVVQYGRFIAIGCMQYNIDYIRNAFNQLLKNNVTSCGAISTDGNNIFQTTSTQNGQITVFSITNIDALTILNTLETLASETAIDSQN